MDINKIKKLPYLEINSNLELDLEKIILNKEMFNTFQEYIKHAYMFCSKTNPFSELIYEKIHDVKNRVPFQNLINLLDSKSHEKILKEALEKECNIHLYCVKPENYKEIEFKLFDLTEEPILDSNNLRFGFSHYKELTKNTASAILKHKRESVKNLTNTNNFGLKIK